MKAGRKVSVGTLTIESMLDTQRAGVPGPREQGFMKTNAIFPG